ncbi:MAG: 3-hydroxyacyl-CoA dehydrogenase family protein [Myxococcales bacterium]|nr:3-hydroxyacyl-CoA dehydrogenase family protein [Myxococcales bacterium]MDP3499423.1 3-hydroxyacyl-CoA dehydrogenase family protein [Myxococcales bacterium]
MSELKRVGVIGAGTMGHGIAQVSAQAGFEVVLYDVTKAAADAGRAKIEKTLGVGVEKQKVTPEARDAAISKLSTTDTLDALKGCQLVVEAAPEKLALKQELFKQLSAICAADTILATNTSSLSLTEIASAASNPGRVVGLHFFNPVHLMKLLEVVRAFQTSDETIATVRAYGAAIGKELIVVKDSPGFASSRLGVALGLEATRMLEEGVASAEDIDRAMKLGYGHPMGPLELGDLVGLDVRLAIAEYLYAETGSPTFRPPQLLKKMVRAGKLGKKSGEGFYRY